MMSVQDVLLACLALIASADVRHTTAGGGCRPTRPDPFVVAVGLLVALWCAGFAAISVWFELTDYTWVDQYADEATALSVVNWFVAALKGVGAVVALLGVGRTPRFLAPTIVGTLLWAAFATLPVYGSCR